jgi:hypothetical protein
MLRRWMIASTVVDGDVAAVDGVDGVATCGVVALELEVHGSKVIAMGMASHGDSRALTVLFSF